MIFFFFFFWESWLFAQAEDVEKQPGTECRGRTWSEPLETTPISDREFCMQLRQCRYVRLLANTANHCNNAELRIDLCSKCYFTSIKWPCRWNLTCKKIGLKKEVTIRPSGQLEPGARILYKKLLQSQIWKQNSWLLPGTNPRLSSLAGLCHSVELIPWSTSRRPHFQGGD